MSARIIVSIVSAVSYVSAEAFVCDDLPNLFMPPRPNFGSPAPCSYRLARFFAAMDWGALSQNTYQAHLSSIQPNYQAILTSIASDSFLARFQPAFAGISSPAGVSTTTLSSSFQEEVLQVFSLITDPRSPHRTPPKIFRSFLDNPENFEELFFKAIVLTREFGEFLPEEASLDLRLESEVCTGAKMVELIEAASPRGEMWKLVCREPSRKFQTFFENVPVYEFREVIRFFLSARGAAGVVPFRYLGSLDDFFGLEAEVGVLEEAAALPLEFGVYEKSVCLNLRLKEVCEGLLRDFSVEKARIGVESEILVQRMIDNRRWLSFKVNQVMEGHVRVRKSLENVVELPFDIQYRDGKSEIFREISILGVIDHILLYFRICASFRLWSPATKGVWPWFYRFVTAESPEDQANELIIAGFHNRLANFISNIRRIANSELSIDFQTYNPRRRGVIASFFAQVLSQRTLTTDILAVYAENFLAGDLRITDEDRP